MKHMQLFLAGDSTVSNYDASSAPRMRLGAENRRIVKSGHPRPERSGVRKKFKKLCRGRQIAAHFGIHTIRRLFICPVRT